VSPVQRAMVKYPENGGRERGKTAASALGEKKKENVGQGLLLQLDSITGVPEKVRRRKEKAKKGVQVHRGFSMSAPRYR